MHWLTLARFMPTLSKVNGAMIWVPLDEDPLETTPVISIILIGIKEKSTNYT